MTGTWYPPAAGTGGFLFSNPPFAMSDPVNHPAHYTAGSVEVIDILEQAVAQAPDAVRGGLQWQVLKYLHRMWHKGNSLQDARKARWYLDRLIEKLEQQP